MPLSGRWAIFWGPKGEREVILEQYDVISVPIHVMRGFRNAGKETALLLAVVGGHEPGNVGWPEEMKEKARSKGFELTDKGTFRRKYRRLDQESRVRRPTRADGVTAIGSQTVGCGVLGGA